MHGERSVNIAKTFKVIGTLYMIDNPPKPQEAKEYLLRAQSIFEQRGLPKMLKEVKEKIMQDLSSTLVLILDNMGRQKAIAALEIYREHEKFRK